MKPELYFDISSENSGGSLFRIKEADGRLAFVYHHSNYDAPTDAIQVFQTPYENFEAFWANLISNKQWYYLHPLFVHPEQRAFVREQLLMVNWKTQGDVKWQQSHQRQWRKVLSDPGNYYNPLSPL